MFSFSIYFSLFLPLSLSVPSITAHISWMGIIMIIFFLVILDDYLFYQFIFFSSFYPFPIFPFLPFHTSIHPFLSSSLLSFLPPFQRCMKIHHLVLFHFLSNFTI